MSPLKVPEVISSISMVMLSALIKSDKTNNSGSKRLGCTNITLQPSGVAFGSTQNDLKIIYLYIRISKRTLNSGYYIFIYTVLNASSTDLTSGSRFVNNSGE